MPIVRIAPLKLKILHANVLGRRFDYGRTWSRRLPKIVSAIATTRPDVITAVECQLAEAKEISAKTGYYYKNYLGSTIFYRRGLRVRVLKTYSWLKNYPHSALVVEVANELNQKVNIAASHLPPFAYRASLRKSQQKKLCGLFDGWNDASIICTDANWSSSFESFIKLLGWNSARQTAKSKVRSNYRTSNKVTSLLFKSGSPIDYVIALPGKKAPNVIFNLYRVASGEGRSDHNFLEVDVQVGVELPPEPPVDTL